MVQNIFFKITDTVERDGIVLDGLVRYCVTVASIDTEIYGHEETKHVTIKKEKHFLPFQK